MALRLNLIILNGRCPPDIPGEFTHLGLKSNSVLDYVLVSRDLFLNVTSFKIDNAQFSDHLPLTTKLCVDWHLLERSHPIPVIAEPSTKIKGIRWSPALAHRYTDFIREKFLGDQPDVGIVPRDPITSRLHLHTIYNDYKLSGALALPPSYSLAKKAYKQAQKSAKREWHLNRWQTIISASKSHNSRKFWSLIKGRNTKYPLTVIPAPTWEQFLRKYFSVAEAPATHWRPSNPLPVWHNTDPAEILELIAELKTGKAPGPDLVPVEAIKLHSAWWAGILAKTFDAINATGLIPGALFIPAALKVYSIKVMATMAYAAPLWAAFANLSPLESLQSQFLRRLLKLPTCVSNAAIRLEMKIPSVELVLWRRVLIYWISLWHKLPNHYLIQCMWRDDFTNLWSGKIHAKLLSYEISPTELLKLDLNAAKRCINQRLDDVELYQNFLAGGGACSPLNLGITPIYRAPSYLTSLIAASHRYAFIRARFNVFPTNVLRHRFTKGQVPSMCACEMKTSESLHHVMFICPMYSSARTPMNQASTRSHCIFTIHISSKEPGSATIRRSKLHLVDLAGSERVAKTGVGGQLLTEAKYINLSLHYLEQVIIALSEKNRSHIPYRNSMMTSVLRDSLGGNCMTTMIATLSIDKRNIDESISTCRFAQRVALIKNEAILNEEIDPRLIIARLKKEVQDLRNELAMVTGEQRQEELTEEELQQ
ncbi:kinesin KIF6 [Podarcis lilfordi]|uniref:Kinesin-like protein n=1 Tax=Podarcis lilfordi TaxID=74358 RepID=A0AA35W2D1_9SAUR|nr:kinesin KIF6 [Podarcis lilfordi]